MMTKTRVLNLLLFASIFACIPGAKADNPEHLQDVNATKYDPDSGNPDLARPNLAFSLTGSAMALGDKSSSPSNPGLRNSAAEITLEYQLSALQTFGVFSIGPSLGIYPARNTDGTGNLLVNSPSSMREFGVVARYQLKYLQGQFLVPYASLEVQSLNYSLLTGPGGRLTLRGGSLGMGLLLNRLAETEARLCYHNTGISRSYLVFEAKDLSGSDVNLSVGGFSLYFGIRAEL